MRAFQRSQRSATTEGTYRHMWVGGPRTQQCGDARTWSKRQPRRCWELQAEKFVVCGTQGVPVSEAVLVEPVEARPGPCEPQGHTPPCTFHRRTEPCVHNTWRRGRGEPPGVPHALLKGKRSKRPANPEPEMNEGR